MDVAPASPRTASQVRVFFVLAFALTWGIGGIGLLVGHWVPGSHPLSTSSPLYYLAGYSVSLAGIALTLVYAGREGLRRLRARVVPWRSPARWYLIVTLGFAAITAIADGAECRLESLYIQGHVNDFPASQAVCLIGLRLAILIDQVKFVDTAGQFKSGMDNVGARSGGGVEYEDG